MKNYGKFATFLVAMIFVLAFSSCEKEQAESKAVDVFFDIASLTDESNMKSAMDRGDPNSRNDRNYPHCTKLATDYVVVNIDDSVYTLEMTSLTKSQTEVVQLIVGNNNSNNVTSFFAFSYDQEEPLYIAPSIESDEVTKGGLRGVPFRITTRAWKKEAIRIDVVCWHKYTHQSYAWNWFHIKYNLVKTICFFGDVCTEFYKQFGDDNGYDLPAHFTVDLTYTNSDGDKITNTVTTQNGTMIVNKTKGPNFVNDSGPLCISYIDNLMNTENATYDLTLHTPTGDILLVDDKAIPEGAWSEDDGSGGFGGDDGIYLFNVGNCGIIAEGQFPPYIPLPKTVKFTLLNDKGDETGRYIATATVTDPSAQGLLPSGKFKTWCVDPLTTINYNVEYDANVYSLINIITIPPSTRMDKIIAAKGKLHWVINHIDKIKKDFPKWNKVQIQELIWHIVDNKTHEGYYKYAYNIPDYEPKVGEFTLVIIDPVDNKGAAVQAFGVRVEPSPTSK